MTLEEERRLLYQDLGRVGIQIMKLEMKQNDIYEKILKLEERGSREKQD